MPINKQFLKSRPEVKVTFAVEKEAAGDAEQVLLLGEFSQWQPIELKRMKNGEFKATLNLPTDGPSHFEYCYQLVWRWYSPDSCPQKGVVIRLQTG
ncbi:early set domain-containing protein [Aeromonas caviae]|uniref:hypothetical protein n=1 Tax=Aeromonas caviae TaxID=648 RepID=UPI0038CFCFF6